MAIRKGDTAQGFELPFKPKETINVGDHIGKDKVVLLFFPFAFSPVCHEEMCTMRDDWSKWSDLDAKVFAVSVDSPFVTDKFRQDNNVPFPVLSDFNKEVISTYGVMHDDLIGLKGVAKRSAFVIDESGTVVYDWISEDPRVQVNFDEILQAVGEAAAV